MNLATSLYFVAESEFIIAAQTFSSLRIAKCGLELTITDHTLNLLYLELLRSSVKFGKRWSGPNFEARLGLLF